MKSYTKTLLGTDARKALKKGIDAVHAPVAVSMGAKGRNTVFREYGIPKPTNDGVSIARRVSPQDEFESMGADLIKEVAEQTLRVGGDGTTTAIVVTHAMIEGGMEAIDAGSDPMEIRAQLERDGEEVIKQIAAVAKPIKSRDEILSVARISVEDEEMAEIVTDAVEKAGEHGAVIVEEGSGYAMEKEEVHGFFWDRGFLSPYMITNPDRDEAILEDPVVIVTDRYMNLNKDLMSTLNDCLAQGAKSALVIADNVEGELLQSFIMNKVASKFTTVAVRKPETQEELEDLAILVSGTAVTKDKGIKQIQYQHTGKAKRVVVTKDRTIVVCDETPALKDRVEFLKNALKEDPENEFIKERLAKLSDGMVVLRVGAKTEAERKYKKDKMDDAVAAARAATEEGVVEGAGATLYKIAQKIENPIMRKALEAPYKQILKNAGLEEKADGRFFNVKTGEEVKDLIKAGIIDPAKVERTVVENAVSLAGTFLTLESVICNFTENPLQSLGIQGE